MKLLIIIATFCFGALNSFEVSLDLEPQVVAKNCPIACPYGWNTWGPFTKNCYLMPLQPVHQDTFDNWSNSCKQSQSTSYPFVINDLVEQALTTVVITQYASSLRSLKDGFLWTGAYKQGGQWHYEDGSNGGLNGSPSAAMNNAPDGSCVTVAILKPAEFTITPCSDLHGVAVCEMEKIPVCNGRTGGMLPISPIQLQNVGNLLPKMPSLPIFGQVFGENSVVYQNA